MPVYWKSAVGILTSGGGNLNSSLDICKLAMTWLGAEPSALNDISTITTASTKEETLCNIVSDSARKAVLEDYHWQFAKRHLQLNPAGGYAESYANNQSISGISQADPAVITFNNNHGFQDGWLVKISNVSGMTQINNRVVRVGNNNNTTFEAYGLNTIAFNAYTSGGVAIRFEAFANYQAGYAFRVPADFLKPVAVEGRPMWEVVGSGNDQRILSTEQYPIIEYIADVSTVSEMPEGFKRAWAARIAAELANPLQKQNAAMKDMWGYYQQVLERESKPADAKQSDPKHLIADKSDILDSWD